MGRLINMLFSCIEFLEFKIRSNPGASFGSFVFFAGFGLISFNALNAQPGNHPDPIWMTRDLIVTETVAVPEKAELRAVSQTLSNIRPADLPVPVFKPKNSTPAVAKVDDRDTNRPMPLQVVAELQEQLLELNLYSGAVDGVFGPGTRAAVERLQKLLGMAPTGELDEELRSLLALRDNPATPERRQGLNTEQVVSTSEEQKLIKVIQLGLSRFGADEISVDGIYGQQTATAIREFQERYKLDVDGKPSVTVLNKLKSIGALSDS